MFPSRPDLGGAFAEWRFWGKHCAENVEHEEYCPLNWIQGEECPHDPTWKHFAVFRTHCHQFWEDLAAVVMLLLPVLMVLVSTGVPSIPEFVSNPPGRHFFGISENGMTIIQLVQSFSKIFYCSS